MHMSNTGTWMNLKAERGYNLVFKYSMLSILMKKYCLHLIAEPMQVICFMCA